MTYNYGVQSKCDFFSHALRPQIANKNVTVPVISSNKREENERKLKGMRNERQQHTIVATNEIPFEQLIFQLC